MEAKLPQKIDRCIAIDLHKHYLVIAGVNREQEVVLAPRRMDFTQWKRWQVANLKETDAVVVESTTNAWHLYDQVEPLVGLAVVANPMN